MTHEEQLREALRDIRDNYDHDEDAHKYGTGCRCCIADAALSGKREGARVGERQSWEAFRDAMAREILKALVDIPVAFHGEEYRLAAVCRVIGPMCQQNATPAAEVGAEARGAECGHVGSRWVCVKARGHDHGHVYELRNPAAPEARDGKEGQDG
jgi:hypothetical protein